MSAAAPLHSLRDAARRRRALGLAAGSLPLIVAAGTAAWRFAGPGGLCATLVAGVALAAALVIRATRSMDDAWVARRLDALRPDLEDSSALLLREPSDLAGLQQLQRTRVAQRLDAQPPPDLRPAWPLPALAIAWTLGAVVTATALLVRGPARDLGPELPSGSAAQVVPGEPRLIERQLDIAPPAYTGLPARHETGLDAKLPAGAQVRWRLRFEPQPSTVALVFHDHSRVALTEVDGTWSAQRTLQQSALYRIVLDDATPAAGAPLHRLEVIPDRPPAIRVVAPGQGVTLMDGGQRDWSLEFEASDDYGLGAARLQLTLAQGGGENVTTTDRTLPISGTGGPAERRYRHRLDLTTLGLAAGDDVIVRLRVDDNRRPAPQSGQSASLILRWPPQRGGEATGLEGMVQRTLPAYFRSQRQVILDTEALVADRGRLAAETFVDRSDGIGMDQRLLRLRYGQFLGEEVEEGRDVAHDDHDEHEAAGEETASSAAAAATARFGHTHDLPEAATLLDRETRELLRSALREMWQAELHLRQGQPERALPYEYRALDRIKQVQQASRIYLARVGLELPPIDATRRLTGDASGVRSPRDALVPSVPDATVDRPVTTWRRLGEPVATDATAAAALLADLDDLARWVRARETGLPQAIELLAAIDALAGDPRCVSCAQRLRDLLWPLVPAPATATGSRAAGGAAGATYLDALQSEAGR